MWESFPSLALLYTWQIFTNAAFIRGSNLWIIPTVTVFLSWNGLPSFHVTRAAELLLSKCITVGLLAVFGKAVCKIIPWALEFCMLTKCFINNIYHLSCSSCVDNPFDCSQVRRLYNRQKSEFYFLTFDDVGLFHVSPRLQRACAICCRGGGGRLGILTICFKDEWLEHFLTTPRL